MAAGMVPALSKEIAGRALAWTPASEEQLIAGNLYVWYVKAADTSGQGTWSKGRLFFIETGMLASGVDGNLRKTLEEKGVREDVISDVLKVIKTEGQGVLAGKAGSKPQGTIGALGSEGSNTLYGESAGVSITTGMLDTFIGRYAGASNTTGLNNTFVGYATGYSSTTASANLFLGVAAGYTNTTGATNIFVGPNAGYANATGSNNIILGSQTGFSNTASNNAFLGNNAGGIRISFSGVVANSRSWRWNSPVDHTEIVLPVRWSGQAPRNSRKTTSDARIDKEPPSAGAERRRTPALLINPR